MQILSSSIKQITQFAQEPQSLLGFYQKKAHLLIQLNHLWHQSIESEWRAHSRIANFQENILTIEVDSSAWASRLRYWTIDLLPRLRTWQGLSNLSAIEWYIKPSIGPSATDTLCRKSTPLSLKNRALLESTANTLQEGALKLALRRLAKTHFHENEIVDFVA